ncbi:hypothetical protein NA57DRAFT_54043 [Rhizodiscina lignyota]|uniref:Endoplasmic reticulum-based factor for assembly of V-ATPase-domain-containing protein n=1 Tax=Rhizodiscina lignyota TaxID=1504668 RepID=A0A9P4M9H4_9PEZI|nr:hypothetical protein NA57DRAFT_54043 [Rhizodiscina lignyota]
MVLLCMTPAIVAAVTKYQDLKNASESDDKPPRTPDEPSLDDPAEGNSISHFQLVEISKFLLSHNHTDDVSEDGDGQNHDRIRDQYRISSLLRGASFYNPPPAPKPAPSSEYQALMARLRAAEEQKSYERMLNPLPPAQSFYERFPNAHNVDSNDQEDDVTYADVDRQLTLIINVLVTVVACGIAIWIIARRWSAPARLGLSMSGAILVAVAEVVVYTGYLRRVKEAKGKEKRKIENKEIVETWVIEGKSMPDRPKVIGEVLGQDPKDAVRRRKAR